MTYKDNIKAILECYFTGFKEEIIDSACDRILEQEPKTGHWIAKRIGIIDRELYCDQCGEEALADYPSRFCANCGAKMKGDIKDIESQERSGEK